MAFPIDAEDFAPFFLGIDFAVDLPEDLESLREDPLPFRLCFPHDHHLIEATPDFFLSSGDRFEGTTADQDNPSYQDPEGSVGPKKVS